MKPIKEIWSIVDEQHEFSERLESAIDAMQEDGLDVEVKFSATNDKLCALVIGRGDCDDCDEQHI